MVESTLSYNKDAEKYQPYLTLDNGLKVPQVGLGSFLSSEGDVYPVVKAAVLEYGYRHIDTASFYKNEEAIGKALEECFSAGIKREEIFVTTKLHQDEKHEVEVALKRSLAKLKLGYIDLYLVHWMIPKIDLPNSATPGKIHNTPLHKVWEILERLVDEGLIKSIGVSNCPPVMFLDLMTYARIKPVMNQIELHPYLPQTDVVNWLKKHFNCQVTAYAPIGAGGFANKPAGYKDLKLLEEPVIVDLASKYGKGPAQIILNWHIKHKGHIVIPKTTKIERLPQNIQAYNFDLLKEEYEAIDKLANGARFFNPIRWNIYLNVPMFDC